MKKNPLRLFILASLFGAPLVTASNIIRSMTLEQVTLYLRGGELQGSTQVDIPAGESEILLTNIADAINPNSINVNVGTSAMLLSTTLKNNFMLETSDPDGIKSLQTQLTQLTKERDALELQLAVLQEEITLLKGNRLNLVKTENATIADVQNMLTFVKDNLSSALTEQYTLLQKQTETNEKIAQFEAQIEEDRGKRNSTKQAIAIKVFAEKATTLPIHLAYVTRNVGWTPIYDVRVNDIDSPLTLIYKANIQQYSGLDWSNVKFTLSTANPSEGISAPMLSPWFVNVNDNLKIQAKKAPAPMFKAISQDFIAQPQAELAGMRNKERQYVQIATTNNNGIALQYDINLPYTLKGHSKDNIVVLKSTNVDATYRYVTAPKADENVFLQAQIDDWDKLALLPGKSSVFYHNNYIGDSFITTAGLTESLNINLGKDKRVLVTRRQDLNETSKPSFFGNSISQKFGYTIDVRNAKTLPITLTIYDQLPVIANKVVSLDNVQYGQADYNKETGALTWNLDLKAGETQKIPFSFKISYPKDKRGDITGL